LWQVEVHLEVSEEHAGGYHQHTSACLPIRPSLVATCLSWSLTFTFHLHYGLGLGLGFSWLLTFTFHLHCGLGLGFSWLLTFTFHLHFDVTPHHRPHHHGVCWQPLQVRFLNFLSIVASADGIQWRKSERVRQQDCDLQPTSANGL
jgi:hypothetical protein